MRFKNANMFECAKMPNVQAIPVEQRGEMLK